jgi:hypothetical protein
MDIKFGFLVESFSSKGWSSSMCENVGKEKKINSIFYKEQSQKTIFSCWMAEGAQRQYFRCLRRPASPEKMEHKKALCTQRTLFYVDEL